MELSNVRKYLVEKVNESESKMEFSNVWEYLVEKVKELLMLMENFWGNLVGWMNKVFPPETRGKQINEWIHLCMPFLIGGVVLAIVIWCCKCCCCSGRGAGGRVRMMKAPGRNMRIPRSVFESNPRSYFINLRSGTTLV